MKKICFLTSDVSWYGGTTKMLFYIAEKLRDYYCVQVLSLRMDNEIYFKMPESIKCCVLPKYDGKVGILKQIYWINRYIKKNRIDWMINVDTGMGFYGVIASRGTTAKVITWEHSNYYNNWGSKIFPYLRYYAATKSDAIIVLTNQDKLNYESNVKKCAPIWVIPNPVLEHPYTYNVESRIILSVGHLLKNKGYDRAIEIAASFIKDYPEWKWVICGEGPERYCLENKIRELGLSKQVILLGLVEKMKEIYTNASMLVMTSDMEGLPMVLLEAKSYGLPLVAFDIMTGPRDIIDNQENGFLIKPFDLKEMENKIKQLIIDDELRKNMSEKTKNGMDKFSEKNIIEKWTKLLGE